MYDVLLHMLEMWNCELPSCYQVERLKSRLKRLLIYSFHHSLLTLTSLKIWSLIQWIQSQSLYRRPEDRDKWEWILPVEEWNILYCWSVGCHHSFHLKLSLVDWDMSLTVTTVDQEEILRVIFLVINTVHEGSKPGTGIPSGKMGNIVWLSSFWIEPRGASIFSITGFLQYTGELLKSYSISTVLLEGKFWGRNIRENSHKHIDRKEYITLSPRD